jgi:multidrug efflux pump subunit AcrB
MFPGSRGGAPVYLGDVAEVREIMGPTEIRRENQSRVLRMNGDVITESASIGEVSDSVKARLADMTFTNGYGVIVVDPLIILLAIPMGLVGVVATLWVTNTPLSAPVFLGMILLAGIVVNNSILLVEFVEEFRHRQGVPIENAVVEAGCVRMRPILMTTLTSMVGSLPLALGIGEGSELMRPLAISVVGGIAFSTMLTLFVVPCAYVVLHTASHRVRGFVIAPSRPAEAGD